LVKPVQRGFLGRKSVKIDIATTNTKPNSVIHLSGENEPEVREKKTKKSEDHNRVINKNATVRT
jgi:hypothetical protein